MSTALTQTLHRSLGRCAMSLARGFTLIEGIMVIVVLSIISAVVLPKFTQNSKQARIAALKGAADSIAAAAAHNYALRVSGASSAVSLTSCAVAASLTNMPGSMQITTTVAPAAGVLGTCNLRDSTDATATYSFKIMGA